MKVALFVRVSRQDQNYERQVADLTKYAEKQGWQIVEVIYEKGSATKRTNLERPELEKLEQLCLAGNIKKVMVTEYSRLGRKRGETAQLMEKITAMGISIFSLSLGMETLLTNGKRNPIAGIVIAVMTEIDALETERLAERINSGLDEARRKGKKLGRPVEDERFINQRLVEKYPLVVKDLKVGESLHRTAKLRDLSKMTVIRVKKALTFLNKK